MAYDRSGAFLFVSRRAVFFCCCIYNVVARPVPIPRRQLNHFHVFYFPNVRSEALAHDQLWLRRSYVCLKSTRCLFRRIGYFEQTTTRLFPNLHLCHIYHPHNIRYTSIVRRLSCLAIFARRNSLLTSYLRRRRHSATPRPLRITISAPRTRH